MPDFSDVPMIPSAFVQRGHAGQLPRFVILGNYPGESLDDAARQLTAMNRSVHYLVDEEGQIAQLVSEENSAAAIDIGGTCQPFWREVYHAPDAICFTVGLVGAETPIRTITTIQLIADLLHRHRIFPKLAQSDGGVTTLDSATRRDPQLDIFPFDALFHFCETGKLPTELGQAPTDGQIEQEPSKEPVKRGRPKKAE